MAIVGPAGSEDVVLPVETQALAAVGDPMAEQNVDHTLAVVAAVDAVGRVAVAVGRMGTFADSD